MLVCGHKRSVVEEDYRSRTDVDTCVYIYLYIYIICICIYVYMYVYKPAMCLYTYTCMHTYVRAYMYTYVYVCVYVYVSICICKRICLCRNTIIVSAHSCCRSILLSQCFILKMRNVTHPTQARRQNVFGCLATALLMSLPTCCGSHIIRSIVGRMSV